MFESLNYRGLRETKLLTDCMVDVAQITTGNSSPGDLRVSMTLPKVLIVGLRLCVLIWSIYRLWIVFGNSVHQGLRDANNIRWTARGTLDQPAKIVKFDLTRCAPPHYSFKRAAVCFCWRYFSLYRFFSKFKHFFPHHNTIQYSIWLSIE